MSTNSTEVSLNIFRNDLSWCVGSASPSQIKKLISELKILIYTLETFLDKPAPRKKIAR